MTPRLGRDLADLVVVETSDAGRAAAGDEEPCGPDHAIVRGAVIQDAEVLAAESVPLEVAREDRPRQDETTDREFRILDERMGDEPGAEAVGDDVWPRTQVDVLDVSGKLPDHFDCPLDKPVAPAGETHAGTEHPVLVTKHRDRTAVKDCRPP